MRRESFHKKEKKRKEEEGIKYLAVSILYRFEKVSTRETFGECDL